MTKAKRMIARILNQVVQQPRILLYELLSTNRIQGAPRKLHPVIAHGVGDIVCGKGVIFGVYTSAGFYNGYSYLDARKPGSSITIGDGTRFNNGFSIVAGYTSITIGKRCLIGSGVEILDSNFHGIKVGERHLSKEEWSKPVVIGDDAFISPNVKVMKGVTIGSGSMIAAGSVVTGDIPAGVIAGGIPARVIRAIE